MNAPDARQYAPATERNRQPILDVLLQVLPPTGNILEISSGTGEHAAFFAPHFQSRLWLPSDPNPDARASIAAWAQAEEIENIAAPLALDVQDGVWGVENQTDLLPIGAIVNINMIHIAPWSACVGLMAGAGRILPTQGVLYLYGPYKREGQHTAPSNATFDESLRSRNPEWGVRDLAAVVAAAAGHGFKLSQVVQMPANNLSVVFHKA